MVLAMSMDSIFSALYKFLEEIHDAGGLDGFSFTYSAKPNYDHVPLLACFKSLRKLHRECKVVLKIMKDLLPPQSVLSPDPNLSNIDATNNNIPLSSTSNVVPVFDIPFEFPNDEIRISSQQVNPIANSSLPLLNEADISCNSSNLAIPFSKLNIDPNSHNASGISNSDDPTNSSVSQGFMTDPVLPLNQSFSSSSPRVTTGSFYVSDALLSKQDSLSFRCAAEVTTASENERLRAESLDISAGASHSGFSGQLPFLCCGICSVACLSMSDYTDHVCRASYKEQQRATEHLITVLPELMQMKKFICNVCRVEFRTYSRILYHLPRCSPGPYSCSACSKVFPTQKALNYHKKKAHGGERCFLCEECGKTFERKTSLRKHSVLRHEYDTMSSSSSNGQSHDSFQCDACPKKFVKKIFLTYHKLRMHGLDKKFLCPTCGNRLMSKNSLMIHMEIHEEEKKFACNHCLKTFRRKEKLQHHIRIHTGERPYQCPKCKKAFVSKTRLTEHINRHNGERRYCCPDCPKSYAAAYDLKKHIQKKHNRDLQAVPVLVIPSSDSNVTNQVVSLQEQQQQMPHPSNKETLTSLTAPSGITQTVIQHRLQITPNVVVFAGSSSLSDMEMRTPSDAASGGLHY